MDVLEMLLDENCNDNITLYDEDGEPMEFEQIAMIPVEEDTYFILRPIGMEELEDDLAFVFKLIESEDGVGIDLVDDDEIADLVFEHYYALFEEDEE